MSIQTLQVALDDMKFMSTYVFKIVGGAISWNSFKHSITASSTMQTEFVTCYEATIKAVS